MRQRLMILTVISVLFPAVASGVQPEGIVFEAEAISTPPSAWLDNRSDDMHWKLWTQEQDIDKKRSGGAVLASTIVKADRATPEEGAPPLHSVVSGLEPGWYRVFASAPGRPLAYSLDSKEWFQHQGGELSLGIWQAGDKPFELWVDDRYAHPAGNPGPGYYDYLRFVPYEPPAIENVEVFSPEPGKVSVCWTTNVPLATGWVELVDGSATTMGNTLNVELVATAYELTGDKKYVDFCRELLREQFSGTQSGMSKTFAQSIRQTIFGLDRLSLQTEGSDGESVRGSETFVGNPALTNLLTHMLNAECVRGSKSPRKTRRTTKD